EYRQRRAAKRAAAARRAAPAGVAIRADKASRQVGTDSDSAASGATGTDADDDGDPFLVAEAIASELGPAARGSGGRPNRQVSDLIDRAWSADGEGERTDR
ncbi:MAG: hypothetical protein ACK5RL_09350, partial [Acidimicrobiales bacterium]